jgi:cysteinyl-tRNA synthetase
MCYSLSSKISEQSEVTVEAVDLQLDDFYSAVCDDLNMPRAMAAVWEIVRNESLSAPLRRACVESADAILGLDLLIEQTNNIIILEGEDGEKFRFECEGDVSIEYCKNLVNMLSERRKARAQKKYAIADKIRQEINDTGVIVKDMPDGSTEIVIPTSVGNNR